MQRRDCKRTKQPKRRRQNRHSRTESVENHFAGLHLPPFPTDRISFGAWPGSDRHRPLLGRGGVSLLFLYGARTRSSHGRRNGCVCSRARFFIRVVCYVVFFFCFFLLLIPSPSARFIYAASGSADGGTCTNTFRAFSASVCVWLCVFIWHCKITPPRVVGMEHGRGHTLHAPFDGCVRQTAGLWSKRLKCNVRMVLDWKE